MAPEARMRRRTAARRFQSLCAFVMRVPHIHVCHVWPAAAWAPRRARPPAPRLTPIQHPLQSVPARACLPCMWPSPQHRHLRGGAAGAHGHERRWRDGAGRRCHGHPSWCHTASHGLWGPPAPPGLPHPRCARAWVRFGLGALECVPVYHAVHTPLFRQHRRPSLRVCVCKGD